MKRSLATADKRLLILILCFVHIVLSKLIIGYLLHEDVDNCIFYIIYDHGSMLAVPGQHCG